jgi:hypothetical protein
MSEPVAGVDRLHAGDTSPIPLRSGTGAALIVPPAPHHGCAPPIPDLVAASSPARHDGPKESS